MLQWIMRKVMGTKHERELKRIRPVVAAVNDLEREVQKLSDEALKAKTRTFREMLDNGAKLDDLLVPAFATCREASKRVLGMRHYDVQLIGGMILHEGKIAEMKTGEGKTLVATLPCYLNALEGKGVHVVTVNDYLARRDAEWMGRLYGWLGLSTGVVVHSQRDAEKKRAYKCDITYGQNNEFGFDYLRDNMKLSIFDCAQRELNFAIVDEVDSILIDEARTPLIISGPGETATDKYKRVDELIPRLRKDEHYTVDEKGHSVTLTEEGIIRAQKLLLERGITKVENLYDPINLETLHCLQQCLRAHTLYKRDQHYMVTADGKVVIIDEFTGRALAGRRWSDGLHQAVEAKEQVPIQDENRTLATISFQNLFRLYKKLAGMTGTADTEAAEFHKIYNLDVVVIPTNKPIQRRDEQDLVYKTEREKFKAVVEEILDCHERGQPVLVGTTSVEKSEALHRMLDKQGIPHNVLNAKQHESEAYVVAQAGRKGAVTIATNMAGRGTDILLGGNPEMLARMDVLREASPELKADKAALERAIEERTEAYKARCEAEKKEVLEAGGLHILGTERHESRRIDNQLRGRAGRQGDPGSSRFFLSLEDDLMRIFAGERIQALMERLGMEEGVPIEHPWVTQAVENAQTKVEERNFDIRKHLLEYDDVMNQQRKSIYALRRQILEGNYRVLPTEEERKKGKQPERVVHEADERLTKLVLPVLEEMVKAAIAPLPPGAPPAEVAAHREFLLGKSIPELLAAPELEPLRRAAEESGQPLLRYEALEQWVYRDLGCAVSLKEYADDPEVVLEVLKEEVPMSLTEQRERLLDLVDDLVSAMVVRHCPERKHFEDWDLAGLRAAFHEQFGIEATGIERLVDHDKLMQKLYADAEAVLSAKEKEIGSILFLRVFRTLYLQEIDKQWVDHLQAMEALRDGIGLRGYGQRDPKKEYKKEGFDMFVAMMDSVKSTVASNMFRFELEREEDVARLEAERQRQAEAQARRMRTTHVEAPAAGGEIGDDPTGGNLPAAARMQPQITIPAAQAREIVSRAITAIQAGQPITPQAAAVLQAAAQGGLLTQAQIQVLQSTPVKVAAQRAGAPPAAGMREGGALGPESARPGAGGAPASDVARVETVRRDRPKIGRNDPCWCGSGKKYKQCHLREDQASAAGGRG
jgi:preprotein translocase subunit SecA